MKLQIILVNRGYQSVPGGFIMMEIILAFSLFSLFTISYFTLNSSMQSIKVWSINELDSLKSSVHKMDNLINTNLIDKISSSTHYGNFSKLFNINDLSIIKSDLVNSWGSTNCSSRIFFNPSKTYYHPDGIFLGSGNISTDMEIRNSIIYLVTDSSTQSQADFFIIDSTNPSLSSIISSLNTGPGLSALVVAGPYVYVANTSSISQLQIIDIHNRESPTIISQLKVPLPEASSTPPKANSIFYKNGFVYLGTSKWAGPEFYIVDVSNPNSPNIVSSFETNTLINDIYVINNFAYLATSDILQMRTLDISDKSSPILKDSFSSTGWQTQEGKVLDYFEENLGLGRTVGGFNNISNHEAFIFSSTTDFMSKDIPGGVYGLLIRSNYVFLATHSPLSEFQIWNLKLSTKIFSKSLGFQPVGMSCDWSNIYFTTGNDKGFAILKL
jgi:hypothetical protein